MIRPIMVANASKLLAGAAGAVMVPAAAQDLYRTRADWMRLNDTPPPMPVQGFDLHGRYRFEVGDTMDFRDLSGRGGLAPIQAAHLTRVDLLTDAEVQALGYSSRDEVDTMGGRRVWFVALGGVERQADVPPPDVSTAQVINGESGTVETHIINHKQGEAG